MADIVTGTVTGQVDVSQLLLGQSDIRREQEQIGSDIRRETAKEASDINANVVATGDRTSANDTAYFIAGQNINFQNATALAALKSSTDANFNQTLAAIQLAAANTTAAATLAGEKTASAAALGQALIGQQIVQDGNTTRALINQLNVDNLNRKLIEQNAALVEARGDSRFYKHGWDQSQFAAVSSQVQNLNSQMSETRQGVVNLGTMSGSAGTSNSTNVA